MYLLSLRWCRCWTNIPCLSPTSPLHWLKSYKCPLKWRCKAMLLTNHKKWYLNLNARKKKRETIFNFTSKQQISFFVPIKCPHVMGYIYLESLLKWKTYYINEWKIPGARHKEVSLPCKRISLVLLSAPRTSQNRTLLSKWPLIMVVPWRVTRSLQLLPANIVFIPGNHRAKLSLR